MQILLILGILLGLYLFFFVGPAAVSTFAVFARREATPLDRLAESDPQFIPFAPMLREARDFLEDAHPATVEIAAKDGVSLRGRYYDRGAEKTVLLLHGYRADPMVNCAVQGESFLRRGWNVLLPCQRAHGASGGDRTGLGLLEQNDLMFWADWIRNRTTAKTLVVYGVSMGAATAGYASDRLDPAFVKALVLDSGFTSPYLQIGQDCKKRHIPRRLLMPWVRLFSRLYIGEDIARPVTDALSKTTIPAFFLHGTADQTVPWAQGRANFDACVSRKEFFTSAGAAHTMSFLKEREQAEEALFSFLETAC